MQNSYKIYEHLMISKSEYGKVNVLKCSYLKTENGFMKLIQIDKRK